MINVGELVGSLSAAPLNDYLGRKGVFMIGTLAIVIGVVLQLVTNSSRPLITAGRAILGYGVGNFSATSPLYMGVRYLLFYNVLTMHLLTAIIGNCPRVSTQSTSYVLAAYLVHLPDPRCWH